MMNQAIFNESGKHSGDLLKKAVDEVLETMFFIFLEPTVPSSDPPAGWEDGEGIKAEIEFVESWKGKLCVYLGRPMCKIITTNFIGKEEEEEVSEEIIEDTIKEMINMIGGRLAVIIDPQKTIPMDLPKASIVSWSDVKPLLENKDENLVMLSDQGVWLFRLEQN